MTIEGVSCVIPTHLRPKHLERAIESVLRQTFRPVEILVVDDACDRESRDIVDRIKTVSDIHIRYVENEAQPGACGSRNLGARLASEVNLSFLDDDDIWFPTFCEHLHSKIRTEGVDLVVSSINRRRPNGDLHLFSTPLALTTDTVLHHRVGMTGSNFIVRKSRFLSVGGFDPAVTVFNDWDLFIRLIDSGISYTIVEEVLAEWVDHPGDRISKPTKKRADGIEFFLSRHGRRMSPEMALELRRTALGLRWRYDRSHRKLAAVVALAGIRLRSLAHGI